MAPFTRAVMFSDLHLQSKPLFLRDCHDYVAWLCDTARSVHADLIIFGGDWFHDQTTVGLDALHMGEQLMEMLTDVAPVHMLVGNHDMLYKDRRDVTSVNQYRHWDKVTLFSDPATVDGVSYVPYLIGTEYVDIINQEAPLVIGHLELPNFITNGTNRFSGVKGLTADDIKAKLVLTGHFHTRQTQYSKGKVPIWYIGSPFGHDFNDVNNRDHGLAVIDWNDGNPEVNFIDWEDQPDYQQYNLSDMVRVDDEGNFIKTGGWDYIHAKTTLKVLDDLNMTQTQATQMDIWLEGIRKHQTKPIFVDADVSETNLDESVEIAKSTVEDVIVKHLRMVDTKDSQINPATLEQMFLGTYVPISKRVTK